MITLFLCSCSSNKDKLNNSSVFSTNTEITEVIVESSAITETDENNESKENTEIKENASLYTDSKAEVESNTEIFSSKPEKTSEPESTTNERSEEIPKENTEKPIIEPIKSVPLNADADDCNAIAQLLVEHINKYREADGVSKVKKLNGLTKYAEFRSIQLVTNFKHDTVNNKLKKWNVKVYKKDREGEVQGNATLSGAVYGLFKNGELVDSYTTDENGYFLTDWYNFETDSRWYIQEITPSEGYLLDSTVYELDVSPEDYTKELNTLSTECFEDVIKGQITIAKHWGSIQFIRLPIHNMNVKLQAVLPFRQFPNQNRVMRSGGNMSMRTTNL